MKERIKKGWSKGFTMAEVLAVVAIISILAAISFVGVVRYQRSLTLTEMDGTARQIYMAAQNHLTAADADGSWDVMAKKIMDGSLPAGSTNLAAWTADQGPSDYPGTYSNDKKSHAFYGLIVPSGASANSDELLDMLLPTGSIDGTVRSGNYVIEFDAVTATVYGVFYTNGSTGMFYRSNPDAKFDAASYSNETSMNSYRTDADDSKNKTNKENRKKFGGHNIIGYYGGGVGFDQNGSEIQTPEIQVINAEVLQLKIKNPSAGLHTDLTDSTMVTDVTLSIKGSTSGLEREFAFDDTVSSDDSKMRALINIWNTRWKANAAGDEYTVNLDDITIKNGHIADLMGEGFLPGEDLILTVKVSSQTAPEPATASVTVNSLFSSVSGEPASLEAVIANGRHLENLSGQVSGLDTDPDHTTGTVVHVTSAVMGRDEINISSLPESGDESADEETEESKDADDSLAETADVLDWGSHINGDASSAGSFFNNVHAYQSALTSPETTETIFAYEKGLNAASEGTKLAEEGRFYAISNKSLRKFAGSNYVLTNLEISADKNSLHAGLFAQVEKGIEISDLTLDNVLAAAASTDSAYGSAAALIGSVTASSDVTLKNILVMGENSLVKAVSGTASGSNVGGLIGQYLPSAGSLVIENCGVTALIQGAENSVADNHNTAGGLIGKLASVSDVSIKNSYAGGRTAAARYNEDKNTTPAAPGWNITAADAAGGLIGEMSASAGKVVIDHCYSTASVYTDAGSAGGLIGSVLSAGKLALANSYAAAKVAKNSEAASAKAGMLIGSALLTDGDVANTVTYLRGYRRETENKIYAASKAYGSLSNEDASVVKENVDGKADASDYGTSFNEVTSKTSKQLTEEGTAANGTDLATWRIDKTLPDTYPYPAYSTVRVGTEKSSKAHYGDWALPPSILLKEAEVEFKNQEVLQVIVTDPNGAVEVADGINYYPVLNLTIMDEDVELTSGENGEILIPADGETAKTYRLRLTNQNLADAGDPVQITEEDLEKEAADTAKSEEAAAAETYEDLPSKFWTVKKTDDGLVYTLTIDDITTADGHFADLYKELTKAKAGGSISAVATLTMENVDPVQFSSVLPSNGLFADDTKDGIAAIANGRHLQNLSTDVSETGNTITGAEILADIRWQGPSEAKNSSNAFFGKVKALTNRDAKNIYTKNSYKEDGSLNAAGQALTDYRFSAIVNANLKDTEKGIVLKGNNHTLRNFDIQSAGDNAGLFAGLSVDGGSATLSTLKLENVTVEADVAADNAGGLIGLAGSGVKIEYAFVIGEKSDIIAKDNAGGLVGSMTDAEVMSSGASAYVNSKSGDSLFTQTTGNAGGLTGSMQGGSIENSFSGGRTSGAQYKELVNGSGRVNVIGGENAGGLAGKVTGGRITKSYSTSSAYCEDGYAGGFAGSIDGAALTTVYATGLVSGSEDSDKIGSFAGSLEDTTLSEQVNFLSGINVDEHGKDIQAVASGANEGITVADFFSQDNPIAKASGSSVYSTKAYDDALGSNAEYPYKSWTKAAASGRRVFYGDWQNPSASGAVCVVTFKWTKKSSGEEKEVTYSVPAGTAVEIPDVSAEAPDNMKFRGWYTEDGTYIPDSTFRHVNSDITVIAKFQSCYEFYYVDPTAKEDKVKDILNSDGLNEYYPSSDNVLTAPDVPSFFDEGYEFDGWYSAEEGGVKLGFDREGTITASPENTEASFKIYARYKTMATYKVEVYFKYWNGSVDKSQQDAATAITYEIPEGTEFGKKQISLPALTNATLDHYSVQDLNKKTNQYENAQEDVTFGNGQSKPDSIEIMAAKDVSRRYIVYYSADELRYKAQFIFRNTDPGSSAAITAIKADDESYTFEIEKGYDLKYAEDPNSEYVVEKELEGKWNTETMVRVLSAAPAGFQNDKTSPIRNQLILNDNELTIKVYYTRKAYQVTYDTDGGSYIPPTSAMAGQTVDLYAKDSTKTGNTLNRFNWTITYRLAAADEKQEGLAEFVMPAADVTAKASWIPDSKAGFVIEYYQQNANNPEKYDYFATKKITDKIATVGDLPGQNDETIKQRIKKEADALNTQLNGNNEKFFLLNENKTFYGSNTEVVKSNGKTVFKVYYDRHDMTLIFRSSSNTWISVKEEGKTYSDYYQKYGDVEEHKWSEGWENGKYYISYYTQRHSTSVTTSKTVDKVLYDAKYVEVGEGKGSYVIVSSKNNFFKTDYKFKYVGAGQGNYTRTSLTLLPSTGTGVILETTTTYYFDDSDKVVVVFNDSKQNSDYVATISNKRQLGHYQDDNVYVGKYEADFNNWHRGIWKLKDHNSIYQEYMASFIFDDYCDKDIYYKMTLVQANLSTKSIVKIYKEQLDGSWKMENTTLDTLTEGDYIFDEKFSAFSFCGYNTDDKSGNVLDNPSIIRASVNDRISVSRKSRINLFYKRKTCTVELENAKMLGTNKSTFDDVMYETPMSTIKSEADKLKFGKQFTYLEDEDHEGDIFDGWYLYPDEDNDADDLAEVSSAATRDQWKPASTDTMPLNNIKLYAHWTKPKFTLNFYKNEGDSSAYKTIVGVSKGDSLRDVVEMDAGKAVADPEKENYAFLNWYYYDKDGNEIPYLDARQIDSTMVTAKDAASESTKYQVRIYAKWKSTKQVTVPVYGVDAATYVEGQNPEAIIYKDQNGKDQEAKTTVQGKIGDTVSLTAMSILGYKLDPNQESQVSVTITGENMDPVVILYRKLDNVWSYYNKAIARYTDINDGTVYEAVISNTEVPVTPANNGSQLSAVAKAKTVKGYTLTSDAKVTVNKPEEISSKPTAEFFYKPSLKLSLAKTQEAEAGITYDGMPHVGVADLDIGIDVNNLALRYDESGIYNLLKRYTYVSSTDSKTKLVRYTWGDGKSFGDAPQDADTWKVNAEVLLVKGPVNEKDPSANAIVIAKKNNAASFTIDPVEIELTSVSHDLAEDQAETDTNKHEWRYDNLDHSDHSVIITSGQFIDGQGLDYKFATDAKRGEPGESENTFTVKFREGTKEQNYSISMKYGTLKVYWEYKVNYISRYYDMVYESLTDKQKKNTTKVDPIDIPILEEETIKSYEKEPEIEEKEFAGFSLIEDDSTYTVSCEDSLEISTNAQGEETAEAKDVIAYCYYEPKLTKTRMEPYSKNSVDITAELSLEGTAITWSDKADSSDAPVSMSIAGSDDELEGKVLKALKPLLERTAEDDDIIYADDSAYTRYSKTKNDIYQLVLKVTYTGTGDSEGDDRDIYYLINEYGGIRDKENDLLKLSGDIPDEIGSWKVSSQIILREHVVESRGEDGTITFKKDKDGNDIYKYRNIIWTSDLAESNPAGITVTIETEVLEDDPAQINETEPETSAQPAEDETQGETREDKSETTKAEETRKEEETTKAVETTTEEETTTPQETTTQAETKAESKSSEEKTDADEVSENKRSAETEAEESLE